MTTERVDRRLMAILAADVAGYSRLVGADEAGTLAQWKAHLHELIEPKIAEHLGRIVRITGDGLLVEFASVIAAVQCAVEVQRAMVGRNAAVSRERRIEFRMGINVGDVIIDGTDMWGEGVNVAARLEALAEPGGICISSRVQEDVHGRLDVAFEDIGEQQLKNIVRPVRVYRVRMDGAAAVPAPALPDKPSMAVLPFNNMSGDPEQEYFADGIVEEIITALSRTRWLFVIARNSSFIYKGRTVDVKQVGRELGVRYVLEGGVRKAANRVRVTAQLIDVSTGAHLWADRFDGALEDIFDLQDQVTSSVVGAIARRLEQAEIERARRKPTENLDAYDFFLRGMASFHHRTKEANNEALGLFYKAIQLDESYASAHGMAAWCYAWRKINGWMADRVQEIAEGARLASRAVELDNDDAVALARSGHALAHLVGDVDSGIAFVDRALVLNPNLAASWYLSGFLRLFRGEPDVAIKHFAQAIRLSPLDPEMFRMEAGMAFAHFFEGRFDEASSWAEKAFRELPSFLPAVCITAASNAFAGRTHEAHRAMQRLRELDPALRVSNLKDWIPFRRPQDFAKWSDGLRKAGLPE